MRAVSVLEVATPALWEELALTLPDLDSRLGEALDARRRVVPAQTERKLLSDLQGTGNRPLVRYARRQAEVIERDRAEVAERLKALPTEVLRVLHAAQRQALEGEIRGSAVWDPEHDAASVRALHGAGLIRAIEGPEPPYEGRYTLHPDLPEPPAVPYDFEEAVMEETDDLSEAGPGVMGLLHDLASLAAAVEAVRPRRTLAGSLSVADARKLGRRLGDRALAADGHLDGTRWALAWRALEALAAIDTDPLARTVHLDPALETTLEGESPDAADRLVHRLVERDLHAALPAVREALRQAGEGAVDEVIFLDLLREQHRDVLYPAWLREGEQVYPAPGAAERRPWDEESWERVERRAIRHLLSRLERMGLVRRAPGIFASTEDGRRWSRATDHRASPIWVTSDLELMVPPDAVTPWERMQLERLGRCLARDVVDRYRLERKGLERWLGTHDLSEAIALLRRRAPGVPQTVVQTLEAWAESAMRLVLTRGVLLS